MSDISLSTVLATLLAVFLAFCGLTACSGHGFHACSDNPRRGSVSDNDGGPDIPDLELDLATNGSPRIQMKCVNLFGANLIFQIDRSVVVRKLEQVEDAGWSILAIDSELEVAVVCFISSIQRVGQYGTISVNAGDEVSKFFIIRLDGSHVWNTRGNVEKLHSENSLLAKCYENNDATIPFSGNIRPEFDNNGKVAEFTHGSFISIIDPTLYREFLLRRLNFLRREIDLIGDLQGRQSESVIQYRDSLENDIYLIERSLVNVEIMPCIIYECNIIIDRVVDGNRNPFKDMP